MNEQDATVTYHCSCTGNLLLSISNRRVALGVQMQQPPPLKTKPLAPGTYQLDAVYDRTTHEAKIFIDGRLEASAIKKFSFPTSGSVSVLSGCHSIKTEVCVVVSYYTTLCCEQCCTGAERPSLGLYVV